MSRSTGCGGRSSRHSRQAKSRPSSTDQLDLPGGAGVPDRREDAQHPHLVGVEAGRVDQARQFLEVRDRHVLVDRRLLVLLVGVADDALGESFISSCS